jgi:hypothetical protein
MQTETQNLAVHANGYQPDPLKVSILAALHTFIRQRPGLDWRNYRDRQAYRGEVRDITRDLKHAETLLRKIELAHSITGRDLLQAAKYSGGRLSLTETPDGVRVDYCTGQYWPTEYRRAVARFCASVLWDWVRDKAMPPAAYTVAGKKEYSTFHEASAAARDYLPAIVSIEETYRGMSGGDWLRRHFRREYGRAIASRFFN